MFTLIKREIEDNIIFYLMFAILSLTASALMLGVVFYGDLEQPGDRLFFIVPSLLFSAIGLLGISALGSSQMYVDRTRKVSAFLSGLAVTRGRLFAAKITAGVIGILLMVAPIAIAAMIAVEKLAIPIPVTWEVFREVTLVVFLVYLSGYSMGLVVGWAITKFNPGLLAIALTILFLPFVIVKGFGPEAAGWLVLFNGAVLMVSWRRFSKVWL
jgi:hypothetical protein